MLVVRDYLKIPIRLTKNSQANWKKVFKQEAVKLLKYLENHYSRSYGTITFVLMEQKEMDAVAEKFHSKHARSHTHTDVLTFSYTESEEDSVIEGDVLLCPERIFTLATADKRPHGHAFMETALHGMLHLYGMTHTYTPKNLQKVYQIQNTILNNTQLNWIKIDELVQSI